MLDVLENTFEKTFGTFPWISAQKVLDYPFEKRFMPETGSDGGKLND
jgi:hypothetical protein